MLPPAGQSFEKLHFLEMFINFGEFLLRLSSRGLAGVLPPAGQIFEKWYLLENFVNFGEILCAFQDNPNFFVCFVARVRPGGEAGADHTPPPSRRHAPGTLPTAARPLTPCPKKSLNGR